MAQEMYKYQVVREFSDEGQKELQEILAEILQEKINTLIYAS